jgi:hypothetical protein
MLDLAVAFAMAIQGIAVGFYLMRRVRIKKSYDSQTGKIQNEPVPKTGSAEIAAIPVLAPGTPDHSTRDFGPGGRSDSN